MRSRLLSGAIIALLVTACGNAEPASPFIESDGAADDPAGAWELVRTEPVIEIPADARVTMEVTSDGGTWQVGGTTTCNSYGGTVTTDGNAWRAQGYGATAMACDEPRMTAERAYLDALEAVDTWARPSPDELVLTGPGVELRFGELPPVPLAELTASTWVLDSLMTGTGPDAVVTSTIHGAEVASLRLEVDGTVAATTGCRSFSGEWMERGDEILLTTFGEDDDSPNVAADGTITCEVAVLEQEGHVLSVLGDGFSTRIDGQHLTLASRDGLGLIYRLAQD